MNKTLDQEKVIYNPATTEVVLRKRTLKLRTPFSAIGPLTNIKRKNTIMQADVFDLLDQVSKGAFHVFTNLKSHRNETDNVSRYTPSEEMTKTDKEVLSRRLKELKDVGLIRGVRKEVQVSEERIRVFSEPRKTFVINPELIRCTNHDEAEYLWRQCARKTKEV